MGMWQASTSISDGDSPLGEPQRFEVFSWSENFETHITFIDEQHRTLVNLINELAYATTQNLESGPLDQILQVLVDYTNSHLQQEEAIWREHLNEDPAFVKHLQSHAAFSREISRFQTNANRDDNHRMLGEVLLFLVDWLADHILGSDMHLAKTVVAIQEGLSLEAARSKSKREMSGSKALIDSVLIMHKELSRRALKLLQEEQERQVLYNALVESEERERIFTNSIMTSIPGLIYLIDEDACLVRWNRKLSEITGYTDEELKSIGIADLTNERGKRYSQVVRSEKFLAENYAEYECELLRKDKTAIPFLFTLSRLEMKGKKYFGGVGLDITSQKKTESQLRVSRDLYRSTERLTRLGHWKLDHITGALDCSEEIFRILGTEKTTSQMTYEALLESIHPDDRETVSMVVTSSIREMRPYTLVHRLLIRTGDVKYVRQQGYTDYDKDGNPLVTLGSVHDISQDILAKQAIEQKSEEAKQALIGTVAAVAKALEARDPYTAGHEQRVSDLAVVIAEKLGLGRDQVVGIRLGASVHDIGKLAVPVELLTKPTRLSDLEFALIKVHPTAGFDMLSDVQFPWPIKDIVLQHHERLDGSGYPNGLKGDEISLEARIVAVADVFEAMSAHRPYRPALGIGPAIEELKRNRGKFYDAACVDALLAWVSIQPEYA